MNAYDIHPNESRFNPILITPAIIEVEMKIRLNSLTKMQNHSKRFDNRNPQKLDNLLAMTTLFVDYILSS